MSSHDPGITDWEGVGPGGSLYEGGFTSAAHGWATGVLPALTNDLLGARPTGPGFSTWSVQPHPGTVTWARGQVPTPHGPLGVSWSRGSGTFTLTVTVPAGTSGVIAVPAGGDLVEVQVDGAGSLAQPQNGYVTMHGVGAGSHTVTVREVG
jgi:hypothetical protein